MNEDHLWTNSRRPLSIQHPRNPFACSSPDLLIAAVDCRCYLLQQSQSPCFSSTTNSSTSVSPSPSIHRPLHRTMASRSLPRLVQSSVRRVPSVAGPQQRALSSLRQAASRASTAAGASASSSSVKTAVHAAGSVAARRYAHAGEKSEYMVRALLCMYL